MSILKLLASLTIFSFAVQALASNVGTIHPRTLAARNATPNAHQHNVHAHIHSQRPHHIH